MPSQPWSTRLIAAGRPDGASAALTSRPANCCSNGSPNATWDGRLAFSPPQDAVQEVRVKASDTDAAFGHTAGGTMNQITKSGTNTLHGSGWEFNQPNTLTANDFFLNQAGTAASGDPLQPVRRHRRRPVLHSQSDRHAQQVVLVLRLGGHEGRPAESLYHTVPTDADEAGQFQPALPTIYDPFSATQSGTTINRTAFPNNKIPDDAYLNPIAKAYLQLYPEPNVTRGRDGINNFASAPNTTDDYSNEMGRLDYNMSDRSRMFFDIRHTDYTQTKNNYFNNIAEGSLLYRNNWGVVVDEVYTLNPTNVFDVRLNFTRMNEGHNIPSVGFDPTTLGFPSYMAGNSQLSADAGNRFQQRDRPTRSGATGANKLPVPVLAALPHLGEDQGQPYPEGRRRLPPVPPEYLHRRRLHRHFHLQQ